MCGENVLTPFPSLFLQSGLLSKKPSEFFHGYSNMSVEKKKSPEFKVSTGTMLYGKTGTKYFETIFF
jgi:hypothetical protein